MLAWVDPSSWAINFIIGSTEIITVSQKNKVFLHLYTKSAVSFMTQGSNNQKWCLHIPLEKVLLLLRKLRIERSEKEKKK